MKAGIIIVNYNSRPYLEACLAALLRKTPPPFEVIIVDNASSDDSISYLKGLRDMRIRLILNPTNLGFAAACNQGLKMSDSDLLVTMNPDAIVPHDWLPRLAWHLKHNKKALIVGPKSKGIGGRQWAGLLPGSEGLEAADKKISRLYRLRSERAKFLIGCLLFFDRRLLETVGYFDEQLILGADDFDLSLRVRKAGYELRVAKDLLIHHTVHGSFYRSDPEENRRMERASYEHFQRKWRKELKAYGWEGLFHDCRPVFTGEKPFKPYTLMRGSAQ
jgi:GT2 family glycosyltransferase